MSKFAGVIQSARQADESTQAASNNQKTRKPDSQIATTPIPLDEAVNLSIKISRKRRQHWAAEAKRQGTTITAAVTDALSAKFGEPQE